MRNDLDQGMNSTATLVGIILWSIAAPALAHNPLTGSGQERAAGIVSAFLLLGYWLMYCRGSFLVRPALGKALTFHLVFFLCVLTILGPLDDLAQTSSAAHMAQHMLMIVVIAPLWVLSQPLPQVSAGGGRSISLLWRPALRLTNYPMYAAYLHGAVIWLWHMPVFYMLAVDNPWWHGLEHAFFLLTAAIFWWAVLRGSAVNFLSAVMALLFTLMHTGFLGALLSFAQNPVYGESRGIEDQQLAGLIMWVAGSGPYLLGLGWMLRRWYIRQPA